MDEKKVEGWLKKLEEGRVLKEGWPKYEVGLSGSGGLMVRYHSTSLESIQREAQRFREMGLVEGKHFTVKMPEEGHEGYVYVRREGLERAARPSVYGSKTQREPAAAFVNHIFQRAGRRVKTCARKPRRSWRRARRGAP